MTITVSFAIDVPNLADGVGFYCAAFGFTKTSVPVAGVAVLQGNGVESRLLESRRTRNPRRAPPTGSAVMRRPAVVRCARDA
jgi:hypothetical protein